MGGGRPKTVAPSNAPLALPPAGYPLGAQVGVDALGAAASGAAAGGAARVAGAALPPPPPPAPRSSDGTVSILVKPRLQTETWSLYWKAREGRRRQKDGGGPTRSPLFPPTPLPLVQETMATKTKILPSFTVSLPADAPVSALAEAAAKAAGWPPASSLARLDGFDAPWEAVYVAGHRAPAGATLAAAGLAAGGAAAVVRVSLKPDTWAAQPATGGSEEEDGDTTSSDEEGGAGGGGLWCGV